ncbi:MAG: cyclic nucleotide-binding domain-containing protein [Gammaproteobacteria bacterium]|nr:cyclic nucleotide-binding domain-containing protein [Gammaproteobacteria bacterium]
MANTDVKKPTPKKLGGYLVVSSGAINTAVEKQIASYAKGEPVKPLGELLISQGVITRAELENSLRNQRIARLAGCPIFASLTQADLAALSKHFRETSVAPGEQFIMQGEEDPTLYIIASGLVEVFRINNEGKEISIAKVGMGEPIGEMGYFSGGVRTACVRALEPTQLLRANYDDLTNYFENVPRVALAFTEVVEHRRKELERITSNA